MTLPKIDTAENQSKSGKTFSKCECWTKTNPSVRWCVTFDIGCDERSARWCVSQASVHWGGALSVGNCVIDFYLEYYTVYCFVSFVDFWSLKTTNIGYLWLLCRTNLWGSFAVLAAKPTTLQYHFPQQKSKSGYFKNLFQSITTPRCVSEH